MRKFGIAILLAVPAMAAVTGTVVNRTTGKPEPGASVGFYRFGQGGMEEAARTKTDGAGAFTFDQEPPAQGPSMLRVEIDGVTYNHMMPPGTPATGITLNVFNASKQPGEAKVGKHMILFEPSGGQMTINETYLFENPGKTTWFDPAGGTLRFYLPPEAKGNVEVHGTAPDGMAVPVPTDKTPVRDVYAAKFEIKPGETRFDLTYSMPYTEGAPFTGKIVTRDENTYLIAANGVTLKGEGLNDLGLEPKTQAHIYGFTGSAYKLELTGSAAPAASAGAGASDQQDAGPQIEEILPRVYRKAPMILALALGILALGFALLYRAPAPVRKEGDERGRR
jgi:hypothetical protein